MNYISVCKVCGMSDSQRNTDDAQYCNECYSVEQGFIYTADFMPGIVVDEDGKLHDEHEVGIVIGCEL